MKGNSFLKTKMQRTFILYTMIPVFILYLLFFYILTYYQKDLLYKKNYNDNIYLSNLIEDELKTYEEEIINISESALIKRILINRENESAKSQIYNDIYAIINEHRIKSIFHVTNDEGLVILTNSRIKGEYYIKEDFNWGIFRKMQHCMDDISTYTNQKVFPGSIKTIYSMGKPIIYKDRIIGYILFDLIESNIIEIFNKEHINLSVITDYYDNAIVCTNKSLLNQLKKFKPILSDNTYIQASDDTKYLIHKTSVMDDEINVYTMVQTSDIDELFVKGLISFFILFLILIIVSHQTIRVFSNKMTKPIDDLLEVMEETRKGNLDKIVDIRTNDEFEKLGNYYNETILEIKELMKKNEEQAVRTKVGEIKQLQSQFNPHFLYNTFESIKYMIKIDPDKSAEMMVSLANILRYSINQKYEEVKMKDDLQYVFDYLLLQKYRYGDNFNYNIKYDDKVRDCLFPKLIIQPLIENSILHNFKNTSKLNIDVEYYTENNCLIIKVKDNGEGINEHLLKKIKQALNGNYKGDEYIGLINIHKRVQLKYGKEYGLSIESKEGLGTTVFVKLPFIKK